MQRNISVRYAGADAFHSLHLRGASSFGWDWVELNRVLSEAARPHVDVTDPAVRELLVGVLFAVAARIKERRLLCAGARAGV